MEFYNCIYIYCILYIAVGILCAIYYFVPLFLATRWSWFTKEGDRALWGLLIDQWQEGTLIRLLQTTLFTMMHSVELAQEGLNSIETFDSRPAVQAKDTDAQ